MEPTIIMAVVASLLVGHPVRDNPRPTSIIVGLRFLTLNLVTSEFQAIIYNKTYKDG